MVTESALLVAKGQVLQSGEQQIANREALECSKALRSSPTRQIQCLFGSLLSYLGARILFGKLIFIVIILKS